MNVISKAEQKSLAKFATLPFDIKATQTFAPLLTGEYRDGAGVTLYGKPDALCIQSHCSTFIEIKASSLNHHVDKQSSWWALQQEYTHWTHDGVDKDYNYLTAYFARTNPAFLNRNAWNQSLFKVAAMQAQYGWERYLVCFANNPSEADAKRYAEVGLVFCTNATLAQMLTVIDLASQGLYVPFFLDAHRSGYITTVNPTPNPDYEGFTPDQIIAANRTKYEDIVAARHAEWASPQCHDYF